MKRLSIVVLVLAISVLWSVAAMAQIQTVITRDATVKGDAVRGPLIAGLVNAYFPDTKAAYVSDTSLGEHVVVTGNGGSQSIHFSPKLVAKLQKVTANPRAAEGLMTICPTQAGQLQKAIGPMRATLEPIIQIEQNSICDKKGNCYGPAPTGKYVTLRPYQNVRLVSNTGNHKYPANSVTFKIEYHRAGLPGWTYGTGWGPTIVLRNVTVDNPIRLVDANAGLILDYLERITALKRGQPGNEGDSCWEVVILRDGTIYKDESPAEAPFCRK